jgi:alanyl-tRNA synthetase
MKVNELRVSFLDFFKERGHRVVPSSPLIPRDDPTLLFTTAGMVQFKPMFAGTVKLDYTRATTVQKCLRTSDLENVGKTARHCTFFEMLGNFSFGDYFKKEAIEFAWDYSTRVIGFPKDDIWVSVYEKDDEAVELWNKLIGVPEKKIVRLDKKDNFWGPAGDSGACGPCSELYLDRGPAYGCGKPDCKPGCECDRFLEFWNLVFNQFYQDEKGALSPLPQTGIDTGMGLERLATLIQNVETIFSTDELKQLVDFVCRESGAKYDGPNISPVNVMVEHARALTFAMSDGAYPTNDGRGYVLRRILRRALRFGRQLGISKPFIHKMVEPIVRIYGVQYPELHKSSDNVSRVLEGEEKRFLETLENGMDRLEESMKSLKGRGEKTLSGKDAFVLYDTFGFPLEMTTEIAGENGLAVDMKGFEDEMEKQRRRGKQSWKAGDAGIERLFETASREAGDTVFLGYTEVAATAKIAVMGSAEKLVENLLAGEKGFLVLPRTPFYGESGGQVGDRGTIGSASGAVFRVDDTKKTNKTIIHVGEVVQGSLAKGDEVSAEFDVVRRNLTRANHTATHLLQASLRSVLGEHVHQTGSLVEPERLRFDFTHFNALSDDELSQVEERVNDVIWRALPVNTEVRGREEAVKMGAMAVFDEKYEDTVRVVSVPGVSMELCGGTHMDNTGKIGVFKIMREVSPGAGMRRIEAITLKGVIDRLKTSGTLVSSIMRDLNATEGDVLKKVSDLLERVRGLEKELEKTRAKNLTADLDAILAKAVEIKGTRIIVHCAPGADIDGLRALADAVRGRLQDSVVCLGSDSEAKPLLLCAATTPAVGKGIDCGAIIKKSSPFIGGGGGGRKDMAQAGGKDAKGISRALEEAMKAAQAMLKG